MMRFWRAVAGVLGFDVRPRCVAVEAGDPCPWIGSVVVQIDEPDGGWPTTTLRLCHQHARHLARARAARETNERTAQCVYDTSYPEVPG